MKLKFFALAILHFAFCIFNCSAQVGGMTLGGASSGLNYTNRLLTVLNGTTTTNRLWFTNATRAAFGDTNAIHIFTNSATAQWEWRTAFATLAATNDSNRATGTWHVAGSGAALYGITRYEPRSVGTISSATPSQPTTFNVTVDADGVIQSPANFVSANDIGGSGTTNGAGIRFPYTNSGAAFDADGKIIAVQHLSLQQSARTTNAPFVPIWSIKAISESRPVIVVSIGDSINSGGLSMTLPMTRTLMRFFGTNGGWGTRSSFNGDGYYSWSATGAALVETSSDTNWPTSYYVATNAVPITFHGESGGTVSANRGWVMWMQQPGAGTVKFDFVQGTTTNSITVDANGAMVAKATNINLLFGDYKIYVMPTVANTKILGAGLWDTNKPSAIDYSFALGGRDNWTTGFEAALYTNALAELIPTLVLCAEKGNPTNEFIPYLLNLRKTWTNSDFVIIGSTADGTGDSLVGNNNYMEAWARTNEVAYFRGDQYGSLTAMLAAGYTRDSTHLNGTNANGVQIGTPVIANELLKFLGLLDNAFVSPRYIISGQTNAPAAFRLALSIASEVATTNYLFVPVEFQRTVTGYPIHVWDAFSANTTFAGGLNDLYLVSGLNLTFGTVGRYIAPAGTTRAYWSCSSATFNNKLNIEARLIIASTNALTGSQYLQIQAIPVDTTFSSTAYGPGSQTWSGSLGSNGTTNTFYTPWLLATLPNTNWFGAAITGIGTTAVNTNCWIIGTQFRYY